MTTKPTVLLLGGTGRAGRRVLRQLLERGLNVRALVRSVAKLPPDVSEHPGLTVIPASLTTLSDDELKRLLDGCQAVVSCLGHEISFKGVFGQPRDLVARATQRLCRGIETLHPATPVKFLLMSSVSVQRPKPQDPRRGGFERALVRVLCRLLPPAADNQRAAEFLAGKIGADNKFVEWVVVRPDSLLEGEISEYAVHEALVDGLFAPGKTTRANVAHFLCELIANPSAWNEWKSKMPVIVNGMRAKGKLPDTP